MKIQAAALTVCFCVVLHPSGSHSGSAGAAGEVPGWPEEAQPARGGTRAAHGHLSALPRYRQRCLLGSVCSWIPSSGFSFFSLFA